MEYKTYSLLKDFYDETSSLWLAEEAENNLPLGVMNLEENDGSCWFMASVAHRGQIQYAALMTPPFNLLLCSRKDDNDALNFLAQSLTEKCIPLPGITAKSQLAHKFAEKYTNCKGLKYTLHRRLNLYRLNKPVYGLSLPGFLRVAEEKDMSFLPYWIKAFNEDCLLPDTTLNFAYLNAERAVAKRCAYILEVNGTAVSMAFLQRKTESFQAIGNVYTPDYCRGKGHAASCVAKVSQLALNTGKDCLLFADHKNPTSNKLYQKIGYRQICLYDEINFKELI